MLFKIIVCMAVFAGQVVGEILHIKLPLSGGKVEITLEEGLKKLFDPKLALEKTSRQPEDIFKLAFNSDKDEVIKRLKQLHTDLSKDPNYRTKYGNLLNNLNAVGPTSKVDEIWSILQSLNNIDLVKHTINKLQEIIPSGAVCTAIVVNMVDDPEGFTKELTEVLKLCGMNEANIAKAHEILGLLKTNSKGSDLFLQNLPNYKSQIELLMNLINLEQKSDEIKYYIILNSEIRKLDKQGKQDELRANIITMIEDMINARYQQIKDEYWGTKFNKLIKLYTEIQSKPITFVVKKWMLSTVLEKIRLILLNLYSVLSENQQLTLGEQLLKLFHQVLKVFTTDPFANIVSGYAEFRNLEQGFDSYIGERYIGDLYLTINRAIEDKQIVATDLQTLAQWLVSARINQIGNTSLFSYDIDKIFKTLKSDAEYIGNTLGIKSPELFEGMLDGIKEFLKDRSFNTSPTFDSTVSTEDAQKLRNYGADAGTRRFWSEYASTARKVIETIKCIELLRDQAKSQTTKPN